MKQQLTHLVSRALSSSSPLREEEEEKTARETRLDDSSQPVEVT